MKYVTKLMVNEFKIRKLKMDFMGYEVERNDGLSFHHLIIPHRDCKELGLGEGYLRWNGAILTQNNGYKGSNSHDYLHIIEKYDPEIFCLITSEMIDENIKGRLDRDNLLRIKALLEYFEREYSNKRTKNGNLIVKEEYVLKRVLK